MKEALIIFVRKAESGKVKTRLAAQIGNEKALVIYKRLLAHTKSVATQTTAGVVVFATEILPDECWNEFRIELQNGNDLGEKMLHAFKLLFNEGYHKVIIIGSDCPELSLSHINFAFQQLETHDVVIGPANDGGYYLLGMKKLHEELFQNKSWSTALVLKQTIAALEQLCLSYYQLETLTDVDEVNDIPEKWLEEIASI